MYNLRPVTIAELHGMSAQRAIFVGISLGLLMVVAMPVGLRAQESPLMAATDAGLPDSPGSTLLQTQPEGGQTGQPGQPSQTEPKPLPDSPEPIAQKKQPTRILWVIPNYRASAQTKSFRR